MAKLTIRVPFVVGLPVASSRSTVITADVVPVARVCPAPAVKTSLDATPNIVNVVVAGAYRVEPVEEPVRVGDPTVESS